MSNAVHHRHSPLLMLMEDNIFEKVAVDQEGSAGLGQGQDQGS